jgi:hypothetical protein
MRAGGAPRCRPSVLPKSQRHATPAPGQRVRRRSGSPPVRLTAGPLAQRLYEELTAIQYGQRPDPFGWIRAVLPTPALAALAAAPLARPRP